MRAIWSRAASNPGTCRCTSCVSNTAAGARRGGRTALRGPWRFGTPTSTFVYTTIFAAGLATDARAKAARNREWEQAFARLNEAADRPPPEQEASEQDAKEVAAATERVHESLSLADLPSDLDWDVIHRIVGMELVEDDETLQTQALQSQIRDYAELDCEDLSFDSRFPGDPLLEWPVNTGPALARYNLPPQSLWAPDELRLAAMRRRFTWKKLAMQNLSAGLLIHELLHRAHVAIWSKTAREELQNLAPQIQQVIAMTEDQGEHARLDILEAIENLRSTPLDDSSPFEGSDSEILVDHPAIPSYHQDADGDFYAITAQLNRGLKQLLSLDNRRANHRQAVAIAKICHNILISSAPPDLQTYNTLLAGFQRWRRPALVDSVIAAFYVHKIRPNEFTCREILNYYAARNLPDDFSSFVAKMRGVGEALMLANPSITVNEASQGRVVRNDQNKLYQKVHPTPMVFDALISGVRRFAGFDRALDIYYEMKADGWGLDVGGLTKLLGSCIRRADWEGGLYVWQEINSIKSKAKSSDMAKAYNHMLSLCSVTGNTAAFNQILNELVKRGYNSKIIIDGAKRTTRSLQKKEYVAPAWMADNVLIALSDYIHDVKPSDSGDAQSVMTGEEEMFSQNAPDITEDDEPAPTDENEAWAAWLEHEFGERPKDP
ncbi:hypothetical protein BDW02DRAFT_344314 [Decorospora gaudefroyi]|uniref:Uncharacterized protein n=1 Tax=Decorospora gaudefroyi TaxID=184978 RepID=A0A6A5KD31_9PLEO|nr:hypothetical protein BDW02DRAFT_344314 [Decorospora gaudefroyi]